jgi:predicted DCC family thiol-disulfide oxidoreductase YuxK
LLKGLRTGVGRGGRLGTHGGFSIEGDVAVSRSTKLQPGRLTALLSHPTRGEAASRMGHPAKRQIRVVIQNARGLVEESFDIGGRLLMMFDGHCGFCNASVRWLLRRDRKDRLRFVALESETAAPLLKRHGRCGTDSAQDVDIGTIVVARDVGGATESVLVRSDAVVALLRELPRPWPWVGVALQLVPRAVRDLGYRIVARWRYRIWGRLESCPIPTDEERRRFL